MMSTRALAFLLATISTRAQSPRNIGPAIGTPFPDFTLQDQRGVTRELRSLIGPKGALILFYRSADWCPNCKIQLVELEESRPVLEKQGLRLAAISYDTVGILADFSARRKIGFPLLADVGSVLINRLGLLNELQPKTILKYGVPHPGTFVLDRNGKVISKHFEQDPKERETVGAILSSAFKVKTGLVETVSETRHVKIKASASNAVVRPFQIIRLRLDAQTKGKMHVYAPAVIGYKPISWEIDPSPAFTTRKLSYPPAKRLHLKAIQETLDVYEGAFTLQREIALRAAWTPATSRAGALI